MSRMQNKWEVKTKTNPKEQKAKTPDETINYIKVNHATVIKTLRGYRK